MSYSRSLLAAIAAMVIGVSAAKAETAEPLAVATGQPGSESFTFGTELWAMSQIALMPTHGIVLKAKEVTVDDDRLTLLQEGEVEAALVYGRVPNAYVRDVRAIMALWPLGSSSEEADPVQFLVHKEVPADVIYLVTKAIFENGHHFKNSHSSLGIGHPGEAMTGLDIPLHAGAFRYYREHGFGEQAPVAADYWRDEKTTADGNPASATVRYRDFDDPALDPEEIEQITAACRDALDSGSLTAVLGDLASTGCEVYKEALTDDGAPTGARMVGVAASEGKVSDEASSGQGGPAIRLRPASAADGAANSVPARVIRQPVM